MEEKKTRWLYRLIRWLVRLLSPKYKLLGTEDLPDGPCVIVGNHSHMYGPIAAELYTPGAHEVWCAGEMMDRRTVPEYAFRDFWSGRPKWTLWFYRLLSRLIAPLAELIFTNAHTIGVYHDARLITTFRRSVEALEEGSRVVIFPECYTEHNQIVHAFQDKFVDLGRFFYKKTGKAISFVPLYLSPELGTMSFGRAVVFRPKESIDNERVRICSELMDTITELALAQPPHTVVPYPNVTRRHYPKSRPPEDHPMTKKRVDYSGFSLRRLNEPRFAHLKLLSGWIGYFALYFITENLIPYENCHVIHGRLDDLIPFCEFFVIFYVGWYLLVALSLAYTLFTDVENFKKLQIFIMITQGVAMIVYILYPSIQDLRPAVFPRDNLLTSLLAFIYSFDTPTGVLPSLHVAYSLGILSVTLKDRGLQAWVKWVVGIFVLMVCLAVCFVKQHSYLDVLAALPVCLLAECLVYGKDWWLPRLRRPEQPSA